VTHVEGSYLIGTRPIDHTTCTRGTSGVWYPNFGQGVEIFGWAHIHDTDAALPPLPPPFNAECCASGCCEVCHPSMFES
jgi:hypothetical protein